MGFVEGQEYSIASVSSTLEEIIPSVLDVEGENISRKTRILHWPYHGEFNQRFKFKKVPVGEGYYITSSNYKITVSSVNEGAYIYLDNISNDKTTVFLLNENGSIILNGTNLALTSERTGVSLSEYSGEENQHWAIISSWNSIYEMYPSCYIRLVDYPDLCISIQNEHTKYLRGERLILQKFEGKTSQLFLRHEEKKVFLSKLCGKAIDYGNNTIILWDYHGNHNQQWDIESDNAIRLNGKKGCITAGNPKEGILEYNFFFCLILMNND